MKKVFTLFLGVLLVSTLFAQKPVGVIMKVPDGSEVPVIDGKVDEVWAEANEYNIDLPFDGNTPTLGDSGETTWKALWTEEGYYLLLKITDDEYYPQWITGGGSNWQYDMPEVYFDVNYILEDGLGCQSGAAGNQGHYQFSVSTTAEMTAGEVDTTDYNMVYSFLVDDPNCTAEYFIPFSIFVTNEGGPIDLTGDVGFDVTIIDNDSPGGDGDRQRAVWSNINATGGGESWANMDECGIINFDGAEPPIFVDDIILTVDGAITENNQTLQVMAEVLPEDAASKVVKWVMTKADGSAASASISSDGVITPVFDEEVMVQAISADGFVYSNEVNVSISGQILSIEKVNVIKDGFFDNATEEGAPSDVWYDMNGIAMVVDGVLEYEQTELPGNIWNNGVKQWIDIPYSRKDENYIFSFKAWADADRTFQCKIEDQANGWQTFGVCNDLEKTDGTSFWPAAQMSITTTPTVYTFELTWSNMAENRNIQFNWQLGDDITKIYLDSVMIIAEADLALIPPTAINQNKLDRSFKVYPNPASSKLHVEFSIPNTSVAIYNSVGIKMDEEVVFGTHHMFDVSRYPKGMYFVKANDAVVKFVK